MRFFTWVALWGVLLTPTVGLAMFDVQLLGGKRIDRMTRQGGHTFHLNANEIKGAVHISPIPLVPIGLGVALSNLTFDNSGSLFPYSQLTGTEICAELYFWFPVEFLGSHPYGKIGSVTGLYKRSDQRLNLSSGSTDPYSATYKPKGMSVVFGFKWALLPLTDILLEVDHRFLDLVPDHIELAGAQLSTVDETVTFHGASIMLGIEAGL